MANLTKLKESNLSNKGAEMTVVHPTVGALDWKITVLGADSNAFQVALRERTDALRANPKKKLSHDEERMAKAEMLAACIVGWEGLEDDGKPIEYSREKTIELMSDPDLAWLAEQVDLFLSDRRNFFLKSAAS